MLAAFTLSAFSLQELITKCLNIGVCMNLEQPPKWTDFT